MMYLEDIVDPCYLPLQTLPVVCGQLSGERCAEDRVKLAEVLTRAARRLGPTLPQYRDQVLDSLLTGGWGGGTT